MKGTENERQKPSISTAIPKEVVRCAPTIGKRSGQADPTMPFQENNGLR